MRFESSPIVVRSRLSVAKSVPWIQLEEFVDDVYCVRLELVGYHKLTLLDFVKDLIVDLTVERCLANSHLIDHDTQRPKVHTWARDVLIEHLG